MARTMVQVLSHCPDADTLLVLAAPDQGGWRGEGSKVPPGEPCLAPTLGAARRWGAIIVRSHEHYHLSIGCVGVKHPVGLAQLFKSPDGPKAHVQLAGLHQRHIALELVHRDVLRAAAVRCEPYCSGNVFHGAKVRKLPLSPEDSRHADDTTRLGAAQRVPECCGADEFEYAVHTLGVRLPHLSSEVVAGIHEYLVRAVLQKEAALALAPGRRQDPRPKGFGHAQRGHSNGGCSTTDQQCLAFLQVEPRIQGTIARLDHFRQGAENPPRKRGLDWKDARCRHESKFGVASIEGSTHATHHGKHLLPGSKLATRRRFHHTSTFDAKDPRKLD
mmetsp:Transcript_9551/g.27073  ORF Transcript_9551/g.27073 Transcript_9551/m.27073 type:complete len:331 (+) Transcript_9551:217-1209(+)